MERLATSLTTDFNLEMACTDEMLAIAERLRPREATLVPERRQEITTEGGLDLTRDPARLTEGIKRLNAAGIRTSLFISPDLETVTAARKLGATAIELHTGAFAHAAGDPAALEALRDASRHGASIGLAVHAGHGLTVGNVGPVAAIPEIEELNIGHSVVSRAIFVGLAEAVRELRKAMDDARAPS